MSRWASLSATGTALLAGPGAKLQRIVINSPSAGASLTITDAAAVGSTLSVAVVECGTAPNMLDYGGVLLVNGLFAAVTGASSGKPHFTVVFD